MYLRNGLMKLGIEYKTNWLTRKCDDVKLLNYSPSITRIRDGSIQDSVLSYPIILY